LVSSSISLSLGGQEQQRDEREWDPEAQDDLGHDRRLGWVDPGREDRHAHAGHRRRESARRP
jgi:hypothetical protein